MTQEPKRIVWMGSSRRDVGDFPEEVRHLVGVALFYAQKGGKHPASKPLKGYKGAGVLEIIEDFDTDTYRCVYTVRFAARIYVLHAFKKKSKSGAATPKADMDVVNKRLSDAMKLEGN